MSARRPINYRVMARREHGGVLVVAAAINGQGYFQLIADTGAAQTAITPRVAELLGLPWRPPQRTQRVGLAGGAVVSAPLVELESIALGRFRFEGAALVLPLPPELRVDGLLGVNFFDPFRTTFDFRNATLILREG